MSTHARVVLITAPDENPAEGDPPALQIAKALVDERLVACVNVLPKVRSVYRWQGKVEDDAEQLLICKTTAERVPAVVRRTRELHPYAVPEVIALPVEAGFGDYLRWIEEQTSGAVI